jgi:hypothetical protein
MDLIVFLAKAHFPLDYRSVIHQRGQALHERCGLRCRYLSYVLIYVTTLGTRDPYTLHDEGAGFGLCWKGNPKLLIGFSNDVNELIQVSSDTMSIIIPK